jgi:hypothetical protein
MTHPDDTIVTSAVLADDDHRARCEDQELTLQDRAGSSVPATDDEWDELRTIRQPRSRHFMYGGTF